MSINLDELGDILVKVECCDEVVGRKLELKSKLDEMCARVVRAGLMPMRKG
jgi:hypothetical protein